MVIPRLTSLRWWLALTVLALHSLIGSAAAQIIPPDFRIVMKTGGCLGDCASYTVAIDAEGRVRFDGTFENGVTDPGPHTFQITQDDVRLVLQRVEQLDFFNLADRYHTGTVTDIPGITFEVTRNGRFKQVFNFDGGPPGLRDLERELDRLGQANRWTVNDADALRAYLLEHRPPPADALPTLARKALRFSPSDLLKQVLDFTLKPGDLAELVQSVSNVDELNLLLAAGAPADQKPPDVNRTLLMNAAFRGDLARIERLLALGVAVDTPTEFDETALWFAACGLYPEVVARLLAAGADPTVASTLPLFGSFAGDDPLPAVECPGREVAEFRHLAADNPTSDRTELTRAERAAEKTTALLREAIARRASPSRPRR